MENDIVGAVGSAATAARNGSIVARAQGRTLGCSFLLVCTLLVTVSRRPCFAVGQSCDPSHASFLKNTSKSADEIQKMSFAVSESQRRLVHGLIERGAIKNPVVERVFNEIDRIWFMPPGNDIYAYVDTPQPIGYGVTISAPHMHAMMAELLVNHAVPGAKVLDVGSGSGFMTALFARMVGTTGTVVGVELIPQLVESSQQVLKKYFSKEMESKNIVVLHGNGRLGEKNYGPYDAIHVGAAPPEVPQELLDQLAPSGRLVIPVGSQGGFQQLITLDKAMSGGKITKTSVCGVTFVPLK